jgi:CRP-like cAMP-binding protein
MYVSNKTLSALIAVNPLWKELAEPFSVAEAVSYHRGGGVPLLVIFLEKGIATTTYDDRIVTMSMRGDVIGHHALLHDTPFPLAMGSETANTGYRILAKAGRHLAEQCPASRAILDQYAHMATVIGLLDRGVAADHPDRKEDAPVLNLGERDLRHVPHLAYRLLTLMDADDSRDLPFPQTKISRLLDVRRPTITAMMQAFGAAGAIEQVERGWVRIKNVKLLESFAGQAIVDRRRQREIYEAHLQVAQQNKAA